MTPARIQAIVAAVALLGCADKQGDPGSDEAGEETVGEETANEETAGSEQNRCTAEPVPSVSFDVVVGEAAPWDNSPEDSIDYADDDCEVIGIEVVNEQWLTMLSCEHEGNDYQVGLSTPIEPFAAPPWAVGDAVTYFFRDITSEAGGKLVVLRRAADQALLFSGVWSYRIDEPFIEPISVEPDATLCEAPTFDDDAPLLLHITLGDASLELAGGELGTLAIPGEDAVFTIHAPRAHVTTCCHANREYHLLIQRGL